MLCALRVCFVFVKFSKGSIRCFFFRFELFTSAHISKACSAAGVDGDVACTKKFLFLVVVVSRMVKEKVDAENCAGVDSERQLRQRQRRFGLLVILIGIKRKSAFHSVRADERA